MKVTVTFGDTSVVVPCKAGWTVRDLVEQASRRHRRILEQHGGSEVKTHHLEYTEGGILDMDDLLSDLVEDRDKLVAFFQEVQPGTGRTDSPRETMSNGFSSSNPSPEPYYYSSSHLQYQDPRRGEIEVNEASLKANTPLLVRSSSDSALAPPFEMTDTPPPDDRRLDDRRLDDRRLDDRRLDDRRLDDRRLDNRRLDNRRLDSPDPEISNALRGALDPVSDDPPSAKMSLVNLSTLTRTVNIMGDRGPLGIHVVPYCSSLSGRTLGLHIKGVEANSRSKRENLFQEDECIVQINDTALQDKTFAQSQELFRQAMGAPSVRLEVLPQANKPRYEKGLIGQLFTSDLKDATLRSNSPMAALTKPHPEPELQLRSRPDAGRPELRARTPEPVLREDPPAELRSRPGSVERAASPAGDARSSPTFRNQNQNQNQPDDRNPVMAALANLDKKKGGKRIKIDLKKGVEGLGFTVVTRDSSAQGPGPILVKNILSRGAAIKDGRLQPGDRILEVNGVDMTGRTQEELVGMLRSTRQGESVQVVVARQDDIFLPRELKGEDSGSLVLEDGREQLMYEIPLNETGSAGLGVSLKGNKSRETGEDLGIFIKSIIHGGAAYKDSRLNVNDQLIAVNGESLLGRSNHIAMETLRSSMSSEGNARGTIQLVVLRAPHQEAQMGIADAAANVPAHPAEARTGSSTQDSYQRSPAPYRTPSSEPVSNGYAPATADGSRTPYPAVTTNGGYGYGHYGNREDEEEEEPGFPSPPSPGNMEEINREAAPPPGSHPHRSHYESSQRPAADVYANGQFVSDGDNVPRSRASKSMDMVADESNIGSLGGNRREPSPGGALGPTLGLWKSSSLESLQSAMSEAKHNHTQAQVPFHRPKPHMVRGRGCNQSFRIAIDKSYEGPSEDDDDMSDHSSGHETPASSSSRQDLDAVDEKKKKKKTKEKKKAKKSKGKKKEEAVAEDPEKKSKKKGFGLLRFGRKKDDKSKDAAKTSKNKLEALSEEELDRTPDHRDGSDPRYADVHFGRATPDMEDDDSDPNYARINNFRQAPSPQAHARRAPSPAAARAPAEELDSLYAKVNKPRPPPAQADSEPRLQHQQPRAVPAYDDLDAARRRAPDYDPQRVAPRGAEPRPEHRYEDIDRPYNTQPRRDPYDYPTQSRPGRRDPSSYYGDPPPSTQAPKDPRYYPPTSNRTASKQDVPPSSSAAQRGRHYYEAAGGRVDAYRQASPERPPEGRGRYTSPERAPEGRGRYASPERPPEGRGRYASPERAPEGRGRYDEERQARRKNPLIGAV